MRDLPNLDLLRACAVISVIVEHMLLAYGIERIGYWRIAWMGVVGVLLFFIHTSLVLMWSLERRPNTLDFYIRRIFRIYPLAMAAIAATLLFQAPVAGLPGAFFRFQPPHSMHQLVAAFLLIPNLLGSYQPMTVLWSLPFEVEMYLCLPLLFFFLQRNLDLWPLLLFWGFDVALCRPLFPGAGYNFFLVIPYFLPGMMAYVGFSRHRAHLPAWLFPGLLAVLWFVFMIHPGWRQADALCLVAGLALPLFHQLRNAAVARASHEIAKYSYGLYLVHPFAIVLGLYLLPHRPLALQLAVMLGSMGVLSVAAYHLLERPMMRVGSRLAQAAAKRWQQHQMRAVRIAEAEIR